MAITSIVTATIAAILAVKLSSSDFDVPEKLSATAYLGYHHFIAIASLIHFEGVIHFINEELKQLTHSPTKERSVNTLRPRRSKATCWAVIGYQVPLQPRLRFWLFSAQRKRVQSNLPRLFVA